MAALHDRIVDAKGQLERVISSGSLAACNNGGIVRRQVATLEDFLDTLV